MQGEHHLELEAAMQMHWRHWLTVASKFLSAGTIGVLAGYAVLFILTDLFGVWYMLSSVVAFVANVTTNFVLHRFWTFENRGPVPRQATSYLALMLTLLGMNLVLLYLQVEYLRVEYLFAQVLNTLFLTVISFVVSRRIFAP